MNAVSDLLCELVRFRTHQGGGEERPMCDFLATKLSPIADEVIVRDAPRSDGTTGAYVFARWGTPHRVINAHVDTVPPNAGWSTDPWQPHVAGDRLYGLGSADTKGAIAATLVALADLQPENAGVLFSGDEEAGSAVTRAFLREPIASAIKQAIVCEPTARTAGIAHRGVIAQRAALAGPGGHSSKADHVAKPMVALAQLAVALDGSARRRINDGPAGMTGTCLNIAALHGGVAFNVIPAHAELEWSLRQYPGFDRAAWEHEVRDLAHTIDPAITIATTIDHAPFSCVALAELVRPFVRSIGPLDFWTEAALWSAHGTDAIVIGPGDIARAHAADEFVPLADLDWAVAVYRALLTS